MSVPNLLSLFRLLLVPVFPILLFSGAKGARFMAIGVYAVACITDILDGWIARKYSMITKLGRFLDPLADKLMSVTVFFCAGRLELVPLWAVLVFMTKEAIMGAGALLLYQRISDLSPSALPGKLAAVVFFVVCVLLYLFQGMSGGLKLFLVILVMSSSLFALVYYYRACFKGSHS